MQRQFSGILLAAAMLFSSASGADADFVKWWPHFQAAVAKSDAPAVVQGAHFPMHWENGPTREIKTPDELTGR